MFVNLGMYIIMVVECTVNPRINFRHGLYTGSRFLGIKLIEEYSSREVTMNFIIKSYKRKRQEAASISV